MASDIDFLPFSEMTSLLALLSLLSSKDALALARSWILLLLCPRFVVPLFSQDRQPQLLGGRLPPLLTLTLQDAPALHSSLALTKFTACYTSPGYVSSSGTLNLGDGWTPIPPTSPSEMPAVKMHALSSLFLKFILYWLNHGVFILLHLSHTCLICFYSCSPPHYMDLQSPHWNTLYTPHILTF